MGDAIQELPRKSYFLVADLAPVFASHLGISESAARMRIYRRIQSGEITTRLVLGSAVIDRAEVERILEGKIQ